ncbi:hypothetical protein EW026_g4522 [Hermanssonia centrifuga]|uniref:RRM domain-containing protein n=1 Tax=Hermanssonia centrifuga TaxID=98765 RepID=A0A4V3XAB4_9APHY|nr:hypothetical protein EW026_g4522 [Hermanssonia centrifuga]
MSRPDTHPADFDYLNFDNRDFHIPSQGHGHGPYATRDVPRDFWSPREQGRDLARADHTNSSYYHTPSASMPALSLNSLIAGAGGDGGRAGNGHPGMVAPRMFGLNPAPHNMGPGPGDGWNPATSLGASMAMNGGVSAMSPPSNGIGAGPTQNNGIMPNSNRQHPVTHMVTSPTQIQPPPQQNLALNHHHRASPPRPPVFSPTSPPAVPYSEREREALREVYYARQLQQASSPPSASLSSPQPASSPNSSAPPRSTLWWGELEPWMDEEYAKQVCNLMGWDPVSIKVPRPAPDPITGRQANNPGYCFLTFPSQVHAASVLQQINSTSGTPNALTMPNSSKPFTLNWASSVPTAPLSVPFNGPTISIPGAQNPQYPKEYSIFVGDLAPEVSNSDLVAVFRNPVLGLRNDREPRFIRPFLSCKSAKIMLDPVTGVSRGYGFVRFTDESDQQRALIEMHGLYCLSRPMRISPATAKFKPVPGMAGLDFSQMPFPAAMSPVPNMPEQLQHHQPQQPMNVAPPVPTTKSVSTPLASTLGSNASLGSSAALSSTTGSASSLSAATSLSSTTTANSSSTLPSVPSDDLLKTLQHSGSSAHSGSSNANSNVPSSISAGLAQQTQDQLMAQRYNIPEESWKHHAQARAILSNLIGPNGEQLTSSDPYNTTVFVGGLSPLISEETLRTFFAPFGEIHYVKVPVGKHCGFVQFVRKPDAERAIEKMQGFPIGGSRIRLSWGRSQYKAAQAAAQAAQAAAFQAQYQVQMASQNTPSLTAEQAMQLLEKFGITQFLNGGNHPSSNMNIPNLNVEALQSAPTAEQLELLSQYEGSFAPSSFDQPSNAFNASAFSPFSPDPGYLNEGMKHRDSVSISQNQSQSFSSSAKGYAPWYSSTQQDEKVVNSSGKISPPAVGQTSRPASARAFGNFLGDSPSSSFQAPRASSRQEAPIARPEVSRRGSQTLHSQEQFATGQDRDHDLIQDLNGTLASLNLDNSQGSWKSGNEGALATSP